MRMVAQAAHPAISRSTPFNATVTPQKAETTHYLPMIDIDIELPSVTPAPPQRGAS